MPADIAVVEAFAAGHGLEVSDVSLAKRTVTLTGAAVDLGAAFRVQLSRNVTESGLVFRGRTGEIHVPASLAPVVVGVFGLDDRPQAAPHFRYAELRATTIGATGLPPDRGGGALPVSAWMSTAVVRPWP